MFKTTDIEKIIDEVLKNSAQNQTHPAQKDDIDLNLYDDAQITRAPVKYIEPRDQRSL